MKIVKSGSNIKPIVIEMPEDFGTPFSHWYQRNIEELLFPPKGDK